MQEPVRKDIIAVFEELIGLLKSKEETDTMQIKILSNHVIHNASIFQDEDSISVAILIYSLSKIIERKQNSLDLGKIIGMLELCIQNLKNNDEGNFRKTIQSIFNFIRTVDQRLKLYIHEVINQAQIKKGSKLVSHGISVARASEVLGISRWELMHYLGQTTVIDRFSENVDVLKRLKFARGLFQ